MKKSIVCIFLALAVILVSFAGCGGSDNGNGGVKETEAPSVSETAATVPVTQDRSNYRVAMLGDSLVAGLAGYAVTDQIDFYGSVSLTTQGIFDKSVQGSSVSIINEICGDVYDVVIVMLGINEVSYETSTWISQYKDVIDGIKNRAPGAEVWIHAILPVSSYAEATSQFGVTNARIAEKNTELRKLADANDCGFIDASSVFGAENGVLPDGIASDGIHPGKESCEAWANYIIKAVKG